MDDFAKNLSSRSADPEDSLDPLQFLPALLIEQLVGNCNELKWRDSKESLHAAFMFVDIFGLHNLTDAMHGMPPDEMRAQGEQSEIWSCLVIRHSPPVCAARSASDCDLLFQSNVINRPLAWG